MKPRAQEILDNEIKTIITSTDYEIVKNSFNKLIGLADVLDNMGDEKNADRVDEIVKEAATIWDFLLSGLGGAAATKSQEGRSILDAVREGNLGDFFSKDVLIRIVTNFLLGGGVGLLASELVDVLTQKIPILKWFGGSKFIKMAMEGALTYAVMHSDFVSKLVDGLVQQIEQTLGMKPTPIKQQPALQPPAPKPEQPKISEQEKASDTAQFQIASGA